MPKLLIAQFIKARNRIAYTVQRLDAAEPPRRERTTSAPQPLRGPGFKAQRLMGKLQRNAPNSQEALLFVGGFLGGCCGDCTPCVLASVAIFCGRIVSTCHYCFACMKMVWKFVSPLCLSHFFAMHRQLNESLMSMCFARSS